MMKDEEDGGGRSAEKPARKPSSNRREERLKLALRENLKRRKSQARERGDFMPASSPSGDVARDRGEDSPDK